MRRIISISFLRPWTMIEFERFSAMTSGGRSVTVAPAGPGAAAPGAGVGTPGTPGVPPARRRPPANSWLRMVATSPASAKLIGKICSSSSETCTSTSLTMSSTRRMFEAASVMMRTLVSRLATSVPREDTNGRSSTPRSLTDAYRTGTICVMISSGLRVSIGTSPITVGTARSRAPSTRTIL